MRLPRDLSDDDSTPSVWLPEHPAERQSHDADAQKIRVRGIRSIAIPRNPSFKNVPYPFAQWTNPISKGFCKSGCDGTTRRV